MYMTRPAQSVVGLVPFVHQLIAIMSCACRCSWRCLCSRHGLYSLGQENGSNVCDRRYGSSWVYGDFQWEREEGFICPDSNHALPPPRARLASCFGRADNSIHRRQLGRVCQWSISTENSSFNLQSKRTHIPTIIPGTPVLRKSLTGFSQAAELALLESQSLRNNIAILSVEHFCCALQIYCCAAR
jgi:hypothetical protein